MKRIGLGLATTVASTLCLAGCGGGGGTFFAHPAITITIAITMAVRDMLRKRIEAFSLNVNVFSCGKECRDELTGRSDQCQSRIDTIYAQIEDAQT